MIELIWDSGFKRSYKKRVSNDNILQKKFWDGIALFAEKPFDPKLKTHKLTGKLSGCWAFSVAYDCRVVFMFVNNDKAALLVDIGSHDEVY